MGQGRKCWDVGSVPAEALGALSRRSKNASEELMNAHPKTCGCLCKQGATAMRRDQRRDAHHKPLALGLEENSVLAASGGVLGAQGSPWGNGSRERVPSPPHPQAVIETGTRSPAAGRGGLRAPGSKARHGGVCRRRGEGSETGGRRQAARKGNGGERR